MSGVKAYGFRPAAGRGGDRTAVLDRLRLRDLASRGSQSVAEPEERPRRWSVPSWLTSVWLHALILAAAVFLMQGWDGFGRRGEADSGDSRVTGLLTQLDGSSETDAPPGEINFSTSGAETTLPTSDLPSSDFPTEDEPPVDLTSLPGTELPPADGPGVGRPNFSPTSSAAPPAPGGGGTSEGPAPPAGGLARGETSFLGIRDSGETFVYVIDVSGSMSDDGAINVAKDELMASLEPLHNGQQFQVVFYNEKAMPLRLPGRAPQKLYDATGLNKTLARQQISAVQADLGTKHLPALKLALQIEPDVIFFLTDADEPALTAKDLDEVRKANIGGTRIHAVEFGKGAKLDASPSLERLAQQNHGAYQYRDVTRFRR